jgi:ubiquinone/menaquinone biosynthesis C-methylase UbiE
MRENPAAVEQKDRVRETFDARSRSWQAGYSESDNFRNYNFLVRRRCVLEMLLSDKSAGRFLDAGCGTGDYLPALLERNLDVWCMDSSPGMIRAVKERFNGIPGLHIGAGDVEKMDYPDEFFDGVLCAGVLEYLSDDDQALSEIGRVLKKGGAAVLTVPNKLSPFMMLDVSVYWALRFSGAILEQLGIFRIFLGRERLNRTSEHNHYVPFSFDSKLEDHGLRVVEFSYCSFGSFVVSQSIPFSVAFSKFFERFRRNRVLGLLGLNYIVKVVKR